MGSPTKIELGVHLTLLSPLQRERRSLNCYAPGEGQFLLPTRESLFFPPRGASWPPYFDDQFAPRKGISLFGFLKS